MQISHITFIVHDIERTTVMLQQLFDAKLYTTAARILFRCRRKDFLILMVCGW